MLHTRTHTSTHASMHAHMHARTRARTHARTHACTHARMQVRFYECSDLDSAGLGTQHLVFKCRRLSAEPGMYHIFCNSAYHLLQHMKYHNPCLLSRLTQRCTRHVKMRSTRIDWAVSAMARPILCQLGFQCQFFDGYESARCILLALQYHLRIRTPRCRRRSRTMNNPPTDIICDYYLHCCVCAKVCHWHWWGPTSVA